MKKICLLTVASFFLLLSHAAGACGYSQSPEWWKPLVLFPIKSLDYLLPAGVASKLSIQIEGSVGGVAMIICIILAIVIGIAILIKKKTGLTSRLPYLIMTISLLLGIWLFLVRSALTIFFC